MYIIVIRQPVAPSDGFVNLPWHSTGPIASDTLTSPMLLRDIPAQSAAPSSVTLPGGLRSGQTKKTFKYPRQHGYRHACHIATQTSRRVDHEANPSGNPAIHRREHVHCMCPILFDDRISSPAGDAVSTRDRCKFAVVLILDNKYLRFFAC